MGSIFDGYEAWPWTRASSAVRSGHCEVCSVGNRADAPSRARPDRSSGRKPRVLGGRLRVQGQSHFPHRSIEPPRGLVQPGFDAMLARLMRRGAGRLCMLDGVKPIGFGGARGRGSGSVPVVPVDDQAEAEAEARASHERANRRARSGRPRHIQQACSARLSCTRFDQSAESHLVCHPGLVRAVCVAGCLNSYQI